MRRDLWGLNVAFNVLSICSGVGGLELGIKTAKPNARVLGYLEREAFAAAVLLARMEDACLEPAPIWCGDLAECDFDPFVGEVDCIAAGFPCQPFSVAGKQKGIEDERWIFNDIAAAIRKVKPRKFVFLENVPNIISSGLGHVLWNLSKVGFSNVAWGCLRASTVGASHRRDRIFILAKSDEYEFTESSGAVADAARKCGRESNTQTLPDPRENPRKGVKRRSGDMGSAERDGRRANIARRQPEEGKIARRDGTRMANAGGVGNKRRRRPRDTGSAPATTKIEGHQRQRRGIAVDGCGGAMADAGGAGLQKPEQRGALQNGNRPGAYGSTSELCDVPIFAPGPDDPRWPEFIAANPTIEPALCKLDDGMADRMDRLRAIGNGVCSLQAAVAFHVLENRLRKYAR